MKNKYLEFDNMDFIDNKQVKNFTRLSYLPDLPKDFWDNFTFDTYLVDDDEYIEGISWRLYETTDYWDVLMFLNGITNFYDLPKNFNVVVERTMSKVDKWNQFSNKKLSEEEKEKKYKELLDKENEKNERFRHIKYLTPSGLSDLEHYLDTFKGKPKILPNLIINPPQEN